MVRARCAFRSILRLVVHPYKHLRAGARYDSPMIFFIVRGPSPRGVMARVKSMKRAWQRSVAALAALDRPHNSSRPGPRDGGRGVHAAALLPRRRPRIARCSPAGSVTDRKKAVARSRAHRLDDRWRHRARDARSPPFIATSPALTMASRARLDARNVAERAWRLAPRSRQRATPRSGAMRPSRSRTPRSTRTRHRASIPPHPGRPPRRRAWRARAMTHLRASVNAELGHLDVSERLVRLAALTGDWPSLALGWRSYYAVGRRVPGGPLVRAESELDSLARDVPRGRRRTHTRHSSTRRCSSPRR